MVGGKGKPPPLYLKKGAQNRKKVKLSMGQQKEGKKKAKGVMGWGQGKAHNKGRQVTRQAQERGRRRVRWTERIQCGEQGTGPPPRQGQNTPQGNRKATLPPTCMRMSGSCPRRKKSRSKCIQPQYTHIHTCSLLLFSQGHNTDNGIISYNKAQGTRRPTRQNT